MAPLWFGRAPNVTIPLAPEGSFDIASARGKVLLLDYWASWCAPCIKELPHLQRLHDERSAKCLAASGANQQDGDSCQNDFVMEVAGAMDHAAAAFLQRDGVKITHYGTYFLDMVSGRLIQLTNPDRSRTYVAIHQHAGRLYIHEATVPAAMPEPILFEQSLAWVNGEGKAIRYRTLYTEGYAGWQYPQPTAPPHTLRDLDASREQPPRPPR